MKSWQCTGCRAVGQLFLLPPVPCWPALGSRSSLAGISTAFLSFSDLCLLSASCREVVPLASWPAFSIAADTLLTGFRSPTFLPPESAGKFFLAFSRLEALASSLCCVSLL